MKKVPRLAKFPIMVLTVLLVYTSCVLICKQSLTKVTDAVEKVNAKADREAFIKQKNTGTHRPVDRQ